MQDLYYVFENGLPIQTSQEQFFDAGKGLCYVSLPTFQQDRERLGVEPGILEEYEKPPEHFRSGLDAYDEMSVGCLSIINVGDVEEEMDVVMFIIKPDLLCLVPILDEDGSEARLLLRILAQERTNSSPARVLYRFLERLLKGGNTMLERYENQVLLLEDQLVNNQASQEQNKVIYDYRRELATVRNYYEQLVDISSELNENEDGYFNEYEASLFGVLTAKAERLIQGVRTLNENLMHLREMLDAALNYNLNNIMKVFTLITAIFLPLTLIVGWYGMNFKHMPELEWQHAYPLVIVACILIVAGILTYFKKKKLL